MLSAGVSQDGVRRRFMKHSVEGAVRTDGKVEALLASYLSLLCVS